MLRTSQPPHQARVGGPHGEIITACSFLLLALDLAEDSSGCEDLWQYDGWLLVTVCRRGVEQIERHAGSAVYLEEFCNFGILSGPIGPQRHDSFSSKGVRHGWISKCDPFVYFAGDAPGRSEIDKNRAL
jgi:hypothetical protein